VEIAMSSRNHWEREAYDGATRADRQYAVDRLDSDFELRWISQGLGHPDLHDRHTPAPPQVRRDTPEDWARSVQELMQAGRYDETLQFAECVRVICDAEQLPPQFWSAIARALAALGRDAEALEHIAYARARVPAPMGLLSPPSYGSAWVWFDEAFVHWAAGRTSQGHLAMMAAAEDFRCVGAHDEGALARQYL
jgi:hypothetical protein